MIISSNIQNTSACYDLGLKTDELNRYVQNQQQTIDGLVRNVTDLKNNLANSLSRSSSFEYELSTERKKTFHFEKLNIELNSELTLIKAQKFTVLEDFQKVNRSFVKLKSDYDLLDRSNTDNVERILVHNNAIKQLKAELTLEGEKYQTCVATGLKNISTCDNDKYVQFLQISAADETIHDLDAKLQECLTKTKLLTAQLQKSKDDVYKTQNETKNTVHELRLAATLSNEKSTKLIANFSAQLDQYRQTVAANQLAHAETLQKLEHTDLLFSNANAYSISCGHELLLAKTELQKYELKSSALNQKFETIRNNCTLAGHINQKNFEIIRQMKETQIADAKITSNLQQLFSNATMASESCVKELSVTQTELVNANVKLAQLSQKNFDIIRQMKENQIADAEITSNLQQLLSNASMVSESCVKELSVTQTNLVNVSVIIESCVKELSVTQTDLVNANVKLTQLDDQLQMSKSKLVFANHLNKENVDLIAQLSSQLNSTQLNAAKNTEFSHTCQQELIQTQINLTQSETRAIVANTNLIISQKALSMAEKALRSLQETQKRTVSDKNAFEHKLSQNISFLEHTLSRSQQEIGSCLVNLQNLATTLESMKKNCSAHIDFLNLRLNVSVQQSRDMNSKIQRVNLDTEQRLKDLQRNQLQENVKLFDQIETLQNTLKIMQKSSNQPCRYYLCCIFLTQCYRQTPYFLCI